jgi:dephospho-CoA kinase
MFRIGLTGSIATGKSTVLESFARRGVPVISADAVVHALYRGAAVPAVEALFPGVATNGEVDRQALAAALVRQPEKLAALEAAVHPLVRAEIAQFLAQAEADGAPLAIVDIPLLFETGHDYGLDAVAVTTCDEATLRRRALARPGMTVEKLDAILARQWPQREKKARAAYVFDTDLPLSQTDEMVGALVDAIRARPDGIE